MGVVVGGGVGVGYDDGQLGSRDEYTEEQMVVNKVVGMVVGELGPSGGSHSVGRCECGTVGGRVGGTVGGRVGGTVVDTEGVVEVGSTLLGTTEHSLFDKRVHTSWSLYCGVLRKIKKDAS